MSALWQDLTGQDDALDVVRTAAAAALARRRTTYRSDRRDSPDRA